MSINKIPLQHGTVPFQHPLEQHTHTDAHPIDDIPSTGSPLNTLQKNQPSNIAAATDADHITTSSQQQFGLHTQCSAMSSQLPVITGPDKYVVYMMANLDEAHMKNMFFCYMCDHTVSSYAELCAHMQYNHPFQVMVAVPLDALTHATSTSSKFVLLPRDWTHSDLLIYGRRMMERVEHAKRLVSERRRVSIAKPIDYSIIRTII